MEMRAPNESELPIPSTPQFLYLMNVSCLAIAVEFPCSPAQPPPPVSDSQLWNFPFSYPQKHCFVLPWHPGHTTVTMLTSALSSRRCPFGSAQPQPHRHLGHGAITCLGVWGTLDSSPLGKQCMKFSFPPPAWHRKHTSS